MQTPLKTERLVLRRFASSDASTVEQLAGDRAIAATTSSIPHPYPKGAAIEWIAGTNERLDRKEGGSLAITLDSELIGAVGLVSISAPDHRGEIGYWIGKHFWGQGYCTEAVVAMLEFAAVEFNLTRFDARCVAKNIGSKRVLEKSGFVCEGQSAKHTLKWGEYEDMLFFGLVLPER